MPGQTTLVVEPDEPVSAMLCTLLEAQGSRCVAVHDAEEACQALPGLDVGSAVIDLRLPGRDGWWLVRRIREADATRSLPVVVIAGFIDDQAETRAAELWCECLSKPFTFTALVEKLREATMRSAEAPERDIIG